MADQVLTVTIRGVRDAQQAARTAAAMMRRASYLMDAQPGEDFSVTTEAPDIGLHDQICGQLPGGAGPPAG
jgi:hypothetical protein